MVSPPTLTDKLQEQKPAWHKAYIRHTQAPRSIPRDIAHQLLHDARLPSSASHLYLPCTLRTSLQAILLAFSQWWIRRSGIILDASAGSGTTCNQPARDSWWLSHAVTLAQLLAIITVGALKGKKPLMKHCETETIPT